MSSMHAMSPVSLALMSVAMMVAMMLPSLAPTLLRYHRDLRATHAAHPSGRTLLFAAGYASVWIVLSVLLVALSDSTPLISGGWPGVLLLLAAGVVQLSPWKAKRLQACRAVCGEARPSVTIVFGDGCRLGLTCGSSCAPAMAVLLVLGLMNLPAMALITLAISAERLAPAGFRLARVTGVLTLVGGVAMCARLVELML